MKPLLTTQLKDKALPLINLLKSGSTFKGRDLAGRLNISERELRLIVCYVRLNITPRIASNFKDGYWYETDNKKLTDTFNEKRAHIFSELKVLRQQRKLIMEEM